MTVTESIWGFETQGDEEAETVVGTMVYNTTIFKNGLASLELAPTATPLEYHKKIVTFITNSNFGIYIQFSDVTPGADIDFLEFRSNTTVLNWALRLKVNGDLVLVDEDGNEVGTKTSPPLTADTWHFFELAWDLGNNIIVHVSGVEVLDVTDVFGSDITGNRSIRFMGGDSTAGNPTIYFDSGYHEHTVATGVSDFLGDFWVKNYQNTVEDATDQDDALAAGTWALVGQTPNPGDSDDASANALYQDTGNLTGSTITDADDSNARPGPSGDSDAAGATMKMAGFIGRFKEGNGSGRTFHFLVGNDRDWIDTPTTRVEISLSLTGSYSNRILYSTGVNTIPTEDDFFQYGFQKDVTAGKDIFCTEIWCLLGFVPVADLGDPSADTPVWVSGQQQPRFDPPEVVGY